MKRLICLLAAVLLAFSCADAEEASRGTDTPDGREADLLEIWKTDDEGRTWITAAAQASDGMLLTSPAVLPEKTDGLTVSDGRNEWEVEAVIPDSTGLMAMVLFDPGKILPLRAAWPLMPLGDSVQADSCAVRSGNADGGRTDCSVLSAASLEWHGSRCLLLQLEGKVRPGDIVLNARGEAAGLVVAEYAEGRNRVLALPAEQIARGLLEASALLSGLSSLADPPEGLRVTAEKNTVTIDWTDAVLPEKAEGEEIYLVVADTGNDYLNYYPAETDTRVMRMILTPGRVYIAGFLASAESPSRLPERFEMTAVPYAQKLTAYDFRPTLTAVAEMPEEAKDGQAPVPVTEVTEELLRSGRAYFYSASAYQVEERIDNLSLLITLTDPEENNYRYESSWMYDPAYMADDVWYLPLAETGLTGSLDRNGYPRGEYTLAYYVDGELADTVTFELK